MRTSALAGLFRVALILPMSFAGGGFGGPDAAAEQQSILGRASDIAKGLNHPVPAFFHLIFKVRRLLCRCSDASQVP